MCTMFFWVCLLAATCVSGVAASSKCPVKKPCYCREKSIEEGGRKITVIDIMCNRCSLQSLPKILWKDRPADTRVDMFSFTENYATSIINDSFSLLQPRVIDLSDNAIITVDVGSFRGLETRLEELYLGKNDRLHFPKSIVAQLRTLKILDISGNRGLQYENSEDYFEKEVFPESTSLERLFLKECGISKLNKTFFSQLHNLKELDMSNNEFDEVPVAVTRCKNLKKLNLQSNFLHDLSGGVFALLNKLEWLSLTNNGDIFVEQLTKKSFKGLENSLRSLYLSKIDLDRIPREALSILRKLEYLEICDTNIEYIEEGDFVGLDSLKELKICDHQQRIAISGRWLKGVEKTLKTLSLASNRLEKIPLLADHSFSTLEKLDFSGNNLSRISPRDLKGLESLKILNLDYNRYMDIDHKAFTPVDKTLRELYLRRIALKFLPDALSHIKSLRKLDISKNNLPTINEDFFIGLSAWKYVMKECNIVNISSQTFLNAYNHLNKRIELDLSNNRLNTLEFITNAGIFSKVIISDNAIHCGCHEYKLSTCTDIQLTGRCSQPSVIAGEYIGSSDFKNTMMKICNSTIEEQGQLCPTDEVASRDSMAVCDPATGGDNCDQTRYDRTNSAKKLRLDDIIGVAVFFLFLNRQIFSRI